MHHLDIATPYHSFGIKLFISTLTSCGDSYIPDKWAPFRKPDDSSLAEQNGWAYEIAVTAK